MIWLLVFRPAFYRGLARDTTAAVLGRPCRITGERVRPRNRTWHEYVEHNGEGRCA